MQQIFVSQRGAGGKMTDGNQKITILFVDADTAAREAYRHFFASCADRFGVQGAASAEDALVILGRQEFSAVVCDVRLPGMDGIAMLSQIAKLHPRMLRVVTSGKLDEKLLMNSVHVAHQYVFKPCAPQDVLAVVESGLRVRATLCDEALVALIEDLGPLPTLPQIYDEITTMVRKPDTSLRDIGAVVGQDVSMTAKVLQLVNSAYFGLRRKISSAEEATVFMGIETIKAMVLSLSVFSQAQVKGLPKGYMDDLWEHCFVSANFARVMAHAEGFDRTQTDEVFTSTMVHDIGRVVLVMRKPEEYAKYLGLLAAGTKDSPEVEKQFFGGVDHASVGAFLLQKWGLPNTIVESVLKHHTLMPAEVSSVDTKLLAYTANAFAHELMGKRLCSSHAAEIRMEVFEHAHCGQRFDTWRNLCKRCMEG